VCVTGFIAISVMGRPGVLSVSFGPCGLPGGGMEGTMVLVEVTVVLFRTSHGLGITVI